MIPAPIPVDDTARLDALRRLDILDTEAEEAFDDLTQLAAQICGVPIALVSLVDANRQWFKSQVGFDAPELSRDTSFCGHAIHGQDIFEIPNALNDERFRDNPLVTTDPNIRFYAGAPLTTPDGHNVGALCVFDRVPHQLSPEQRAALARLARQVVREMELRLAARRAREQEVFKQAILGASAVAIISGTTDGIVTSFNAAAERMLGYRAEEMVGKLMPGIFHDAPEVAARAQELSRELGYTIEPGFEVFVAKARAGQTETREWTHVHKNGSRFHVQLSVTAMRDDAGQLTGFVGIAQDITEQKRLQEEQQRLALIVESTSDAVVLAGVDGRLRYLNRAGRRMLGLAEDKDFTRYTVDQFLPTATLTEASSDGVESLKRSGFWDSEALLHSLDGQQIPISFDAIVHYAPASDRIDSVTYMVRDISRRKKMEDSLRESERQSRRLALIAERTHNAVILTDIEGRIEWVNAGFERITDYTIDEVRGKKPGSFLQGPETDPATVALIREHLRQRQKFDLEIVNYSKHGRKYWLQLAIDPLHNERGELTQFMAIETDITERKKAEIELSQARDAAEAASRAKSAFLANMSHEIRTPLNAILGMIEMLEHTPDRSEQAKMLRVARESSKALTEIIDDVLDFSKIEAGLLAVQFKPMSVRDMVASVVRTFSSIASGKNLTLRQVFDERIPAAVKCDPLRLRQILFNLVGNAIKFTAEGDIEIRAVLQAQTAARAVIRFEVADSGIGIDPQAQARLFQPFVQAESDTTRKFGGTGLGLAISRRLAELLGGSLSLKSEAGKGTTMLLMLALAPAEAKDLPATDEADVATATLSEQTPTQLDGRKLLMVDDNAINLRVLSQQLTLLGYHADGAVSGSEALDKWRAGDYALLITDCHMPEMDGYGLARSVREIEAGDPQRGRIPILGYTANALQDSRELCRAAGMDDVLIKPVALKALRTKLDLWLRPAGTPQTAAAGQHRAVENPESTSAIDWTGLHEITGGGAESFWREMLHEFLVDKTEEAQRLAALLADGDLDEIVRLAHRLKGAARTVAARALAEICEQIESAAKGGDRAVIAATKDSLAREFGRVRICIEQTQVKIDE